MKTKAYSFLQTKRVNATDWIYLHRPEAKNAFNLEMGAELLKALKASLADKKVRNIVLTGSGGSFSAGGDIKLMTQTKNIKNFFLAISQCINQCLAEIRRSPKPVIASIPGYAGGIAFGLCLGTDLRVASQSASFQAATIKIGLVANGSATYALPRLVGMAEATDILLTGRLVNSLEAKMLGMVSRVVPDHELEMKTQELADHLASLPQQALGRLKKVLLQSPHASFLKQVETERQSIAWASTLPDFQEGIQAFVEKRKPKFNV